MSNEEIFGIIKYINSLSFSEFEIETGDIKIKIKRDAVSSAAAPAVQSIETVPSPETQQEPDLPCVVAPITGVFYRSPAPDQDAFVNVGDKVKKGDTLCILEAMKMMNEVKSDKDGVIKEILASDGDSVDEATALFIFQGE